MAGQDETDFWQQRGRALYRNAKYTEALHAFTKAITVCVAPKASLLDNRSATYEKLGQLPSALHDAQTTIRRHKKDIMGYLRAGKILQKMDRPEQALDIFRYGLRKVPVSDNDNYALLSSTHEKLSRRLSPPKSQDPFTIFPMEIADIILDFIQFRQMVGCLRVSKNWNRLLTSKSWLWRHLDLSKAKRLVSLGFVSHAIQRSKGKLNRATLHQLGPRDDRATQLVTQACRNLETLEILSSHSMGSSSASLMSLSSLTVKNLVIGKGADITLDTLSRILDTCTSLSRAEFEVVTSQGWTADWKSDLPNLKQLKLVGNKHQIPPGSALNLSALFPRIPNLEALSLNTWRSHGGLHADAPFNILTKLQSLNLLDYRLRCTYDDLPQSLTKLRLNYPISTGSFTNFSVTSSWLASLNELELSNGIQDEQFLQAIAGNGVGCSLEKLIINNSGHKAKQLSQLLDNRRLGCDLRELSLLHSDFNDDTAKFVVDRFPLLRRLDISHTKITGFGVKMLVQRLADSLEYLAVNQCMDLGLDAVDWAAGQRIQVEFRSKEKMVSGRKVRLDY